MNQKNRARFTFYSIKNLEIDAVKPWGPGVLPALAPL